MSQAEAWQQVHWNSFSAAVHECLEESVHRATEYTIDVVEHLIVAVIIYITLCLLLYASIVKWNALRFQKDVKNRRRVLFVIAHPDDECMFFGPTVLNFTKNSNCTVFLMCLSTGSNYGMGKVRKSELYKSCKVLGIEEGCVTVQQHTLLPDSSDVKWPIELVANIILRQVESHSINTLITFDKNGVSRHINHCSIYYAIAHLSIGRQLPVSCSVLVLETINVIRKYWLIFDIPLCFLLSTNRYILSFRDRKIIHTAMKQHKSQLLWFRRLNMLFSRYMIINTLQEMDMVDIELDLEVDD